MLPFALSRGSMNSREKIPNFEHPSPDGKRLDKKIDEGIDLTEIRSGRGPKPTISTSEKDNLLRTASGNPSHPLYAISAINIK